MRPIHWRTLVSMSASACMLGALLAPAPAAADEDASALPTIVEVSPRAVATTDFVTENDAITLTAAGFLPGEEVRLDIASTPRGIEAVHDSRRARADGTVTFPIGGSRGRPSNNYAGGYLAEITSGQSMDEEYLSESFSVLPVVPADGADTGAGAGGATTPIGSIGPRAKNGIEIPSGPGFSVIGVGLSLLVLVVTSAATAVMTRKSQRSMTDDS